VSTCRTDSVHRPDLLLGDLTMMLVCSPPQCCHLFDQDDWVSLCGRVSSSMERSTEICYRWLTGISVQHQ